VAARRHYNKIRAFFASEGADPFGNRAKDHSFSQRYGSRQMEVRFQESVEIETCLGEHSVNGPGPQCGIKKANIIGEQFPGFEFIGNVQYDQIGLLFDGQRASVTESATGLIGEVRRHQYLSHLFLKTSCGLISIQFKIRMLPHNNTEVIRRLNSRPFVFLTD
jgi:hypothetical protein